MTEEKSIEEALVSVQEALKKANEAILCFTKAIEDEAKGILDAGTMQKRVTEGACPFCGSLEDWVFDESKSEYAKCSSCNRWFNMKTGSPVEGK